jgi:hypothetical protein
MRYLVIGLLITSPRAALSWFRFGHTRWSENCGTPDAPKRCSLPAAPGPGPAPPRLQLRDVEWPGNSGSAR